MAAGYDGSIRIDSRIDSKGFNVGINRMVSSLKRLAVAAGIAFGTSAIISFGKTAVKATTELTNAMTGLKSILDGQGRSFKDAQKFINEYVSDGLIPATNAITAYKNLASRGYTDTQIEQVLIALKDSAAFGRQASYSLGEAVSTATEGLKNENSILVDNAGVTKNVAKMWEDYAKSIGTTTNNLTKQQKIQAEITGILEETKFQTGDAAKIANSYSGEVLRLGFNFTNLKIAVGNALLPIAWAVLPSINAIIAALTRLANVFAQVTTAIFGKQAQQQDNIAKSGVDAAKAQDKLAKSTKEAGKEAKKATAPFDDLNVLAEDTASAASGAADDFDLGLGEITTNGEIGAGVTVSSDVQTAIDKIFRMLEPLKSLNFDNLNNAFDRLKKAIEPITQTIFAGLEWAYINLFLPLSKWVIEDILPVFLDLLSGALSILSGVIEVLKPFALWLWENFLQPLAVWTGGIIVDVLGWITERLKMIGEWISDNKVLVQDFIIVIGSFAAAWLLVTTAFKAWNAATTLWNSIGVIASAVTTAFGTAVAFLTSPVTLVVIAIGALIAIVVLLIRHWDEVKEVASKCWDWIKEKWNVAGEWFRTTVVEPIKKFFSDLWENIKLKASEAWEGIKAIWQSVSGWFNNTVIVPVSIFFANLRDKIKDALSTAWTWVTEIWKGAKDWFKKIGEDMFNGLWDGLKSVWEKITKWITDTVDWLKDKLSFWKDSQDKMSGSSSGGSTSGLSGGVSSNYYKQKQSEIAENKDEISAISKIKDVDMDTAYNMWKATKIPKLATGAVIPPNSEFLAILGDQKRGRNIEAPENLIRQIIKEELSGLEMSGQELTINFGGNMAQLIRVLKPYIDKENSRVGTKLVIGGAR